MKSIVAVLTLLVAVPQTGIDFQTRAARNRLEIDHIKDMSYAKPHGNSDEVFWSIVRKGDKAVPDLLLLIEDPTPTEVRVMLFGGFYSVGDLAVIALWKIYEDMPLIEFVDNPEEPQYENFGFGVYWNFVRSDLGNRSMLKENIADWLEANKASFVWESIPDHPAGGTYRLPTPQTTPPAG